MALAAAVALVLVAGCSSDGDASGTTDSTVSADVLGTPNPATGEPVKVGFVADGRTPSIDNTMHVPAGQATVDYINDYMGGLGGRPIDLVTCESQGDPGKATECANELVQESVVMTIMPENQQSLAVHTVMAANDIPLFVYGVTDKAITEDTQSSFMIASLTAGLSALPIDVAKENDIDNVSVLVVDVPAATGFYDPGTFGAMQFEDAGITLNEIKVPLGAPDISQQINDIVSGGDTVVHIVGDPGLCIGAINGLKTNGFDGPVTILNGCGTDAVKEAVGANMEGVIMASPTPLGDASNPGIELWNAILAKYNPGFGDSTEGLTTFITTISARQALEGISGDDITSDTIRTTVKAAPEQPLITGVGLGFPVQRQGRPADPGSVHPRCPPGLLRR